MAEQKRLIRSTSDRVIGGVAGGLARYFDVDPTFVRLAFVVLGLFNGMGVLIYFITWLVVPDETSRELTGEAAVRANLTDMREQLQRLTNRAGAGPRGGELFGIILVAVGVAFLLDQFVPQLSSGLIWPLVMMGLGAYLLFARR